MKSKSATGTAIGAVTFVSTPFAGANTSVWSFAGNVIEDMDTRGSTANSSSGGNGTAHINGVVYDANANITYMQIDSSASFFNVGDTAYYSPSSFASSGTWTNQGVYPLQYVQVNANSRTTLTVGLGQSFGQSSTFTELRILFLGLMGYTAVEFRGTMENVS